MTASAHTMASADPSLVAAQAFDAAVASDLARKAGDRDGRPGTGAPANTAPQRPFIGRMRHREGTRGILGGRGIVTARVRAP